MVKQMWAAVLRKMTADLCSLRFPGYLFVRDFQHGGSFKNIAESK